MWVWFWGGEGRRYDSDRPICSASNLAPPAGSLARAEWYELIVTMANSLGNNFRLWFYPADVGSTNWPRARRMPTLRAR